MSSRSDDFYYDDDERPSGGSVWQTLQRLIKALIVLAVVVFTICAFLPVLKQRQIALQEEEKLRLMVAQRLAVKARKERQLNWLKNDPGYVEMIARDRLDLRKEGETIYRIDTQKTPAAAASPATPSRANPSPTPRS